MGVIQESSQVSSACADMWLCTKMLLRAGSMPQARYNAAEQRVDCKRSVGLCGSVMACMSTTKKKVS
jgi:hypothetical protein